MAKLYDRTRRFRPPSRASPGRRNSQSPASCRKLCQNPCGFRDDTRRTSGRCGRWLLLPMCTNGNLYQFVGAGGFDGVLRLVLLCPPVVGAAGRPLARLDVAERDAVELGIVDNREDICTHCLVLASRTHATSVLSRIGHNSFSVRTVRCGIAVNRPGKAAIVEYPTLPGLNHAGLLAEHTVRRRIASTNSFRPDLSRITCTSHLPSAATSTPKSVPRSVTVTVGVWMTKGLGAGGWGLGGIMLNAE